MSYPKEKTLINLKKATTLLAKVVKMIEDDCYCIDIMQQNLAVIGLLRSVHQMLMENHLNTCFRKAFETKNEKRKHQMIQEILRLIKFYNK